MGGQIGICEKREREKTHDSFFSFFVFLFFANPGKGSGGGGDKLSAPVVQGAEAPPPFRCKWIQYKIAKRKS